jgi:perosamine synthetase
MKKLAIDGGKPTAPHIVPNARVQITEADIDAVVEVLRSGNLRQGRLCRAFEEAFAHKVGAKHATTVANGTAALHAVYSALVSPGDEVLVPAVTFFATASMVTWAGAKPVFCDIDPRTFVLDVKDARRRVTSGTRAIAGVHLFGNSCEVDAISDLAKECDLKVIWDAAQAHRTLYKGSDIGCLGDVVTYSFYATKNMTTGEGGMITSPHREHIDQIILMKQQGQSEKYCHTMLGGNYRMTDMEAALGLSQLQRLDELTVRRREIASYYDKALAHLAGVKTPKITSDSEHSYHQYTVLLDLEKLHCDRDTFVKRLRAENIGVGINYPYPLHVQEAFKGIINPVELPNAETFCRSCISLPIYPSLTDLELNLIVSAFEKVHQSSVC